ncbi:Uncharacterized protein GBIM_13727 [Gryllus bimaculatus]|nr:Uncharacterized protein GBIM_13727 [Gryllus bimaculatus]
MKYERPNLISIVTTSSVTAQSISFILNWQNARVVGSNRALAGAALLLAAAGSVLDELLRRRARLRASRYAECCAAAAPAGSVSSLDGGGCRAQTRAFVQISPAPSCANSDAGADPPHEELHIDNKGFRRVVEKDFLFQSIGNGAFSVDTFFFISGLLVSHIFFKLTSKEDNQSKNKKKAGLLDSAVQFVGAFSYRVLRLTPPYFFVMLMAYLTSQWFSHNSVFPNPVADHVNCPRYWWRNLLYINTLFPVDSMCMIWSWYLANDTQFYTLALILLLLSKRYPKTAVVTLVILVISSLITTAVIVINTDHTPRVEEPLGLFDALYDKPWMRLGPYAVGMAVGLLLHRTGLKMQLHKAVVVSGWALAMTLSFSLVHGLYGSLGPVASAAYVALSHTAWSLTVGWVTVACVLGYGGPVNKLLSHPVLYPLSRITYCAYLTHPVIMLSVLMFMDAPVHMSRGTMSVTIFGYIVSSYLLSMIISLTFEAPVIALLNLLHPIRRKVK